MYKESREKLVEKNISWHEEYTDKTQFLKEQFDDVVGAGSYFRFEGRAPNGDGYYCVIGPAKVHHPRAKFFAGVRKLPATYSAGGKYFDSLDTAAKYAKETWGVPTPKNLVPYTSRQLWGISQKVNDWKAKREEEESKGKKPDKDDKKKKKDLEAFNIDVIIKEAMPMPRSLRTDYVWHTYEAIVSGEINNFEDLMKENPSFKGVLNEVKNEKRKRYCEYTRKYGFGPEKMREIFRTYIGYSRNHGLYVIFIGPYLMNPKDFQRFYVGLNEVGLLPEEIWNGGDVDFGKDIPDDVLRKVLVGKSAELKRLAGMYHSDRSGKYQAFQKPYHVPSHTIGESEVAKYTEKQGLSIFDDYDEVDTVTQAKHIEDHGYPLMQRMGLDDYSYIFNYKSEYLTREKDRGANFFTKKPLPPKQEDGTNYAYGPSLPSDYRGDPLCQIYSFSRHNEARENNMVISGEGTRIFLNRNGLNKLIVNILGKYPQYNDRMLEYLGKLPDTFIPRSISQIISRDMSNFLYFLTGVGSMSEYDISVIKKVLSSGKNGSLKATRNGVLNLDDFRDVTSKAGNKSINPKCGFDIHRKILARISKFYEDIINEDISVVEMSSFNFINEQVARLLAKSGVRSIKSLSETPDEKLLTLGLSQDQITLIKDGLNGLDPLANNLGVEASEKIKSLKKDQAGIYGLFSLSNSGPRKNKYDRTTNQGAFLKPSVALVNTALLVTSKAKNEMRLMSEIAKFMAAQNIDTVSDQNAELVSSYLNSGGDTNPEWHSAVSKSKTLNRQIGRRINHMVPNELGQAERKVYFSKGNVKPFMAKILSSKILSSLIELVKNQNIQIVDEYSSDLAVNWLETKGHTEYFTSENVVGVLGDAIYRVSSGKDTILGDNIQDIARETILKASLMEEIYANEKKSRKEDKEESGSLNLIWNDFCPRCGKQCGAQEEGQSLMSYCQPCDIKFKPEFETFDTHESFHEVFQQIRDIVETMSYKFFEKDEKVIDPVTKAVLVGDDNIYRVPPIFHNPPKDNMRSGELAKVFAERPEEEKKKYRTLRSDKEMAALLTGDFSEVNMSNLNQSEYKYLLDINEIDEAMELQIADDFPTDEEDVEQIVEDTDEEIFENQPVIKIDPETEPVQPQEEVEIEQQPPAPIDPFANFDFEEEEGFDAMINEEEENNKTEASKEVINNLLKLSKELDDEGKSKESIELLRLAKKFSRNIKKGK